MFSISDGLGDGRCVVLGGREGNAEMYDVGNVEGYISPFPIDTSFEGENDGDILEG